MHAPPNVIKQASHISFLPLPPSHPLCASVCCNRWRTQWASPHRDTEERGPPQQRKGQLLPRSPEQRSCLGLDVPPKRSPEVRKQDGAVNLQLEWARWYLGPLDGLIVHCCPQRSTLAQISHLLSFFCVCVCARWLSPNERLPKCQEVLAWTLELHYTWSMCVTLQRHYREIFFSKIWLLSVCLSILFFQSTVNERWTRLKGPMCNIYWDYLGWNGIKNTYVCFQMYEAIKNE